MKKIKVLSVVFSIFAFANVHSQDLNSDSHTIGITIPSVAIVDIEPEASKSITMAFTAPTEAGLSAVAPPNNTSLWLNYSFIPTAVNLKANISVEIDALVPGVDISVKAAAPTTTVSGGTLGNASTTAIVLSSSPSNIISDIGASYTGDGASNGYNLTYSLASTTDYANLYAQTPSVTVTYTISE